MTTNNKFEATTGFQVRKGAACAWDDGLIEISGKRISGTGAPDVILYKGCEVLSFSYQSVLGNEKRAFGTHQMSHAYREGSDVIMHLHWGQEDATAGNVVFRLTYSWANMGAGFAAETTLDMTVPTRTTPADPHNIDAWTTISGAGKTISSILLCSVRRYSSNAADTLTGKYVIPLYLDLHYERDTDGSRTSTAK